jgi:signal transduction histidine kinase
MVSQQTESKTNSKGIKFSEVLEDILYDCTDAINKNKIKIGTDFDHVSEIKYVEAYLKSIMKNLITNAIKYSSENGNPIVHISTQKLPHEVLMIIKDNGMGIDMQEAGDDLFKPFKRFTTKSEGTGMGLYIVKNIIEKNGGRISVESKPNEGTTFYCFLKEYHNSMSIE